MKYFPAILATQQGAVPMVAQEGIADSLKEGFAYIKQKLSPKNSQEAIDELNKRSAVVSQSVKDLTKVRAIMAKSKDTGSKTVSSTKLFGGTGFKGKTAKDFITYLNNQTKLVNAGDAPKPQTGELAAFDVTLNKQEALAILDAVLAYSKAFEAYKSQAVSELKTDKVAQESFGDVLAFPFKVIGLILGTIFYMWFVCFTLVTLWVPLALLIAGGVDGFQDFYGAVWDKVTPSFRKKAEKKEYLYLAGIKDENGNERLVPQAMGA